MLEDDEQLFASVYVHVNHMSIFMGCITNNLERGHVNHYFVYYLIQKSTFKALN